MTITARVAVQNSPENDQKDEIFHLVSENGVDVLVLARDPEHAIQCYLKQKNKGDTPSAP